MNQAYKWGGTGLVVMLFIQVYAAGWGLFGAGSMQSHIMFGWLIGLYGLLFSLVIVPLARVPKRELLLWLAVAALIVSQPFLLFAVRRSFPPAAALHAVNAVLAIVLALVALQAAGMRNAPPKRAGRLVTRNPDPG